MAARLEVRLDDERQERLEELRNAEGLSTSEVVRRLIDDAWEEVMRTRRIAAVERLIALNGEDVPDPDTLSRELGERYEPRRPSLMPMFPSTLPAEATNTRLPALASCWWRPIGRMPSYPM